MSGGGGLRGTTLLTAVIGAPIRHSLSPVIFNAAFAAAGLDWAMAAFEVAEEAAADALAGARALGLRGLSVTMPLKGAVAAAVPTVSEAARRLEAVNSVRIGPDGMEGDNTDGPGLLDALRTDLGWTANGQRCAILGAGGAARSVVDALAAAGAADVVVINRDARRGSAAAALAGAAGRVGTAADAAAAAIVINATSVGMAGTPAAGTLPLDPVWLRPGQVVVDLVYNPLRTPLLEAAEDRGATAVGGVAMLVHQAARQFSWWTGAEAPVTAMRNAAEGAIAHF